MAAMCVLTAAAIAAPPPAVVTERRASMHRAGDIMRDLRADILAGRDPATLLDPARRLATWAGRLPALFPPGSDADGTNALGTVWSDRAGFDAAARGLAEQADRLAAAASAGNRAAFTAAYVATDDACDQCHRAFRRR